MNDLITNKQWNMIALIQNQDYAPMFTGKTKKEASEYIDKFKDLIEADHV